MSGQFADRGDSSTEKKYKCILGGDFNTELGRGLRSMVILSFAAELGLDICNNNDEEDLESQWTFRSCLGRLRRLDYIMVDTGVHCKDARPCNVLDLSSDHRAVGACIKLRAAKVRNKVNWFRRPNPKHRLGCLFCASRKYRTAERACFGRLC